MANLTLPVLPLTDGVLLPGMVVPVELDSEAQAAVDAARTAGAGNTGAGGIRSEARVLVVPRLDGEYAAIGTVAILDQVGRLPTGEPGALLRGTSRARVGQGVTGPGAALWVEATPVEPDPVTEKARELAAEYKTVVEGILQARGAWQLIDSIRNITDPGQLADTSGYALVPGAGAEGPDPGDDRRRGAADAAAGVVPRIPGRGRGHREDPRRRARVDGQDAAGVPAAPAAGRDPQGARRGRLTADEEADYRTRVEAADLPEKVKTAALREVGKLERASDQNPEARLDPHLARHRARTPVDVRTEDSTDVTAAREVLDADHHGLSDVKDRIVEHLAVRARRASRGLDVVGGRGSGRGAGAGRAARRGQDLARRVGRPRAGPQLRPGVARWRPGRGRDPRPPAHVRRRAAGPARPGHQARPAR